MVAKAKKAPSIKAEPFETSIAEASVSAELVPEKVVERLAGLDVRAQSALLRGAFKGPDPLLPDVSDPSPERPGIVRRMAWRAVKSVLGLGVVIIAGVGPVQRLLEFSSVEAVVNARLVTLRAPIEGGIADVDFVPGIGAAVTKGQVMVRISNGRADRARLDDLQRQIDQAESDRPGIAVRLARLKEIYEQISHQAHAFQAGRISELEERVMDLKAQASATDASEFEAASTLSRTRALAESGYQTTVAVERAERDAKIAAQTKQSLDHRLFASVVELEAARRGEYVGDSYNDRPSSLQHADELSIRIAETEAELNSRNQRIASLHDALDAETSRYAELSRAELSSPTNAQVWEVLVSPGEEVRKGQDLLRLLDCSGAVVTATVRESVFNRLRLGDKAQFRLSEQSGRYDGTIVRMSGSAAPSDNLAIQQTGLSSGGYRIAVSVPDIASTQCGVGRTGTVVFNPSRSSGTWLQSLRDAVSFLPGS
ncbi:HlyD family efflux transporter periplasmic adaptor subunit [Bradyrhizobium sp. Tv2a-2]|uniref:HlyD family secretion protein n=1 Tax=Bradyrhizobium sp. Tv2a-2 TaxID=113395 RepID=UPI0004021AA5|nr:HlyD family efflux transporter periplasmic adaptor subunit [Bradyrhizobium sp. Tv2a-2]